MRWLGEPYHVLFIDLFDVGIMAAINSFVSNDDVGYGMLSFELGSIAQHECAAQAVFGFSTARSRAPAFPL